MAVDDGTVTVTAPPYTIESAVELASTVSLDSLLSVDSSLIVDAAFWLVVEGDGVEALLLVLSPGTYPRTAATAALEKHPTDTPVVVFSGMAAHMLVSSQPTTSHEPSLVQYAYSASTQAYWPAMQAESVEISSKAALSLIASARLSAYFDEVSVVVPLGTGLVMTDVGM